MTICIIYREEEFSPNSVEKDKLILDAVSNNLRKAGHDVEAHLATELTPSMLGSFDIVFSMARGAHTLALLREAEKGGVKVINSANGVAQCCHRYELERLLRCKGIAVPPEEGENGVWLKRGDIPTQHKEDIVFCHNEEERIETIKAFRQRGIDEVVQQAHIMGDLVKFYGVEGTDFFHIMYPTDNNYSKLGFEEANGQAQHYAFDINKMKQMTDCAAQIAGIKVYGGDAVVTDKGQFYIIDFNDWPSFSCCRDEAAEAIVQFTIHNS